MTHRPTAVLLSCALLVGAGCVTEPEPGDQEPVTTVAVQAKIPCDDPFCGNTNRFGVFPFWELDMSMTSFSPVGGFRIKSMTSSGGVALRPDVDGFVLRGRTASDELVYVPNFKMQVEADTGEVYELTFAHGGLVQYLDVAAPPNKPTYYVTYRQLSGINMHPQLPLCTPTLGNYPRKSLVFRGDRYDIKTGRVSAIGAAAGSWFNIACEDDAIWKLAMMQLVEVAERQGHHTTQDQRTAGVRAIRADYCGTGTSYTVLGTDVDWQNDWLTHDAVAYPNIEAIWTNDGAKCLDTKRIADKYVPCRRASCATLTAAQTAGLMSTYVKPPPP
jgi:ADYC domain